MINKDTSCTNNMCKQLIYLYTKTVKTNRHTPCNKPDLLIQEKESDKCLITDMAILSDYNFQKKATEKISKYVDLQIECERMWD